MAQTYKDAYTAMMSGMGGESLGDEFYGLAHYLLRAIKTLTLMERGEKRFFIVCGCSIDSYYDEDTDERLRYVINWTGEIDLTCKPTSYRVSRNQRGYIIEKIYARS